MCGRHAGDYRRGIDIMVCHGRTFADSRQGRIKRLVSLAVTVAVLVMLCMLARS